MKIQHLNQKFEYSQRFNHHKNNNSKQNPSSPSSNKYQIKFQTFLNKLNEHHLFSK
jgi:hypothetical protein